MIYKRKGEEIVKVCDECETSWKDSWLENYQDENECPMCGAEFVVGEIKVLPPIKNKPKDKIYYKLMKKAEIEMKIEVLQCQLNQLENTGMDASAKEYSIRFSHTASRHVKDLGKIKLKRIQMISLKMILEDLNGQIKEIKDMVMRREKNK